jgi:hypothetical protein
MAVRSKILSSALSLSERSKLCAIAACSRAAEQAPVCLGSIHDHLVIAQLAM